MWVPYPEGSGAPLSSGWFVLDFSFLATPHGGIVVPWQGLKPRSQLWQRPVLTTGPPGNPLCLVFYQELGSCHFGSIPLPLPTNVPHAVSSLSSGSCCSFYPWGPSLLFHATHFDQDLTEASFPPESLPEPSGWPWVPSLRYPGFLIPVTTTSVGSQPWWVAWNHMGHLAKHTNTRCPGKLGKLYFFFFFF